MADRVIEVEAITLTGHRQVFRCAEIVTIDGQTLEEIANGTQTINLEDIKDAVILLQGRIDELSSQMSQFAYRDELHDQLNRLKNIPT